MARSLLFLLLLSLHSVCSALHNANILSARTQRVPDVHMMGRAEKRAAAKRAKKSGGSAGTATASRSAAASDVVSKSVVESRLREVPVFGLLVKGVGFIKQDDTITYYLDHRDAEKACAASDMGSALRVEGRPLDEVYFDKGCALKPEADAVRDLKSVPKDRMLVPDVAIPLYCIDGFQTTDKETGVASLPLFFSRKELLEFATPVYGEAEAQEKVLVTDLAGEPTT